MWKNKSQSKSLSSPILSVKPTAPNQMELTWNFTHLPLLYFQRFHAFYFLSSDIIETTSMFDSYCSQLKIGELVGLVSTITVKGEKRPQINWHQKSGNHEKIARVEHSHIEKTQNVNYEIFSKIYEELKKKRGLISLNIYCGKKYSENQRISKLIFYIRQLLNKIRLEKEGDKIIFNIFSPNSDSTFIDNNLGLNIINYSSSDRQVIFSHFISYLNKLLIKSLTLQLSFSEDDVSIFSAGNLRRGLYDAQVSKNYYSLPKCEFKEKIHLFSLTKQSLSQVQVSIIVHYTFYNGEEVKDSKKLLIEQEEYKSEKKSVLNEDLKGQKHMVQVQKGIFVANSLEKQWSYLIVKRLINKKKKKKVDKGRIRQKVLERYLRHDFYELEC